MSHALDRIWYGKSLWRWLLLPLTGVFLLLSGLRRALYRLNVLSASHPGVPVIVVGNIVVGGTGKTPVVIEICRRLGKMGLKPGVASRGYGRTSTGLLEVQPETDARLGGDEPVLISRRIHAPVVVASDRAAAADRLKKLGCNVIVCDDGLQHYALRRDAEVVVVDGQRGLGNGFCLPAGPLREPESRLAQVDLILINGDSWEYPDAQRFLLDHADLVAVGTHSHKTQGRKPLADFAGRRVHAVAGIGHPMRFFDLLRGNGIQVIEHPLPDHAALTRADVSFSDDLPVIITEKDAVKCCDQELSGNDRVWYLPVNVSLSPAAAAKVDELLRRLTDHVQS